MKGSLLNKAGNSLRGIVCLQNNNNNEENQTLCLTKSVVQDISPPPTHSLLLIPAGRGNRLSGCIFLGYKIRTLSASTFAHLPIMK